MSNFGQKGFCLGLAVGLQLASGCLAAQVTNQVVGSPMPPARSPVDSFRELLAMNPAERRGFLTNRPPESQKRILEKIQEYQSLPPEDCELRLRVTELHYYLMQLLETAPTNRPAQLNLIPEKTRKLVEDRLEQWDSLPDELKQQLLENEAMLHYFTERAVASPPRPGQPPERMTPSDREKLDQSLRRWQSLTPEERGSILKHFRKLFDLTVEEKANVLATLSEPERRQIEKTLESFENLPPIQRAKCLRSLPKFASLSAEERRQFLKDASRWEVMTPTERQAWRDLVYNLGHGPPLPPGLDGLPPRPPVMPRPANTTTQATNLH
jgi:uncharacterized protein DUF3106